jgi:hypothetical protein
MNLLITFTMRVSKLKALGAVSIISSPVGALQSKRCSYCLSFGSPASCCQQAYTHQCIGTSVPRGGSGAPGSTVSFTPSIIDMREASCPSSSCRTLWHGARISKRGIHPLPTAKEYSKLPFRKIAGSVSVASACISASIPLTLTANNPASYSWRTQFQPAGGFPKNQLAPLPSHISRS